VVAAAETIVAVADPEAVGAKGEYSSAAVVGAEEGGGGGAERVEVGRVAGMELVGAGAEVGRGGRGGAVGWTSKRLLLEAGGGAVAAGVGSTSIW
jgi:hypothetical protein